VDENFEAVVSRQLRGVTYNLTAGKPMNRHQRRAAKAQGNGKKLDPVIAIHEAGHAVARVLSAADFGLPAEMMISHIDVGTAENLGRSYFDKFVTLTSQAVTYGPTLSAGLQDVFDRTTQGVDPSKLTKQHIVDALKLAKDEGADVARWLRARMLISTLASVAEARHTGRDVNDVWNSPESEGDLKGAVEDGIYAGLPTDEIAALIGEALDQSEILMKQANVQRAVHALAEALPISGRLKGQQAVFIINRALAEAD
jgi:hypothetical protein